MCHRFLRVYTTRNRAYTILGICVIHSSNEYHTYVVTYVILFKITTYRTMFTSMLWKFPKQLCCRDSGGLESMGVCKTDPLKVIWFKVNMVCCDYCRDHIDIIGGVPGVTWTALRVRELRPGEDFFTHVKWFCSHWCLRQWCCLETILEGG